MQYGIAFTPLVPSLVLWLAVAAIGVIAALLLLGRAGGAALRTSASRPGGPGAVVVGGRGRDRQEPQPEFRRAHPRNRKGQGGAGRQLQEDQGPGGAGRRG